MSLLESSMMQLMLEFAELPPSDFARTQARMCGRASREWDAIAFSTPRGSNNGRLRSPYSGVGHNAACWRVYIAARGRRNGTGTACNLVIDQFVTIWRFVCAGPVNAVYPGSRWWTSKRGLFGDRRERAPTRGPYHLPSSPFSSFLYYEFLQRCTRVSKKKYFSPEKFV